ncbi:MAG: hypothetical protein ABI895_31785 [Deltaproteobacteria bacterium]
MRSRPRWRARRWCAGRRRHFLDLDQEALRFDPFRAGRGVTPVGFVHALRRATYLASQRARPARAG